MRYLEEGHARGKIVISVAETELMAFRKAAELTIGVLYAIGAVHQTFYVLRHSEQFYVDMADQAWLPRHRPSSRGSWYPTASPSRCS